MPGSKVTFSAIVKGSSPLKLKCFRGTKELLSGKDCEFSLKDNQVVLELLNVDRSHAGEYTCQIINDAGKESCAVNLSVKGQFLGKHLWLCLLHSLHSVFKVLSLQNRSFRCSVDILSTTVTLQLLTQFQQILNLRKTTALKCEAVRS